MSKTKVVVAMSGGVDSSVAACLLKEQGYEVVGFFMRTGAVHEPTPGQCSTRKGCCSATDAADARSVAEKLGINFYALNFEREFDQIVDYFVEDYRNARTPNPCILCNDRLKFGKLVEHARSIGADRIATGHYARIGMQNGHAVLRRGVDSEKDQSYVLFSLQRPILERVLFPIGDLLKSHVRAEAERFGLSLHDKPDSYDICFVPDGDYARVVRNRDPSVFRKGPVCTLDGRIVGEHDGIANFTIGQRHGLRIAMGTPHYVTNLDATTNTVTIGPKENLFRRGLWADQTNWLVDRPANTFRALAQIRYHHHAVPVTVEHVDDHQLRIVFDEPQPAVTPGQAVVLYDNDVCLGGGWIRESF